MFQAFRTSKYFLSLIRVDDLTNKKCSDLQLSAVIIKAKQPLLYLFNIVLNNGKGQCKKGEPQTWVFHTSVEAAERTLLRV